MDNSEDKSLTLSVTLKPAARKVIENIRDDHGVIGTEALIRILEWFAQLPLELRLAVLTRNENAREKLLTMLIHEIAHRPGQIAAGELPTDDLESLRVARLALDRLELILKGRARERAGIEPGTNEKAPAKRRGR